MNDHERRLEERRLRLQADPLDHQERLRVSTLVEQARETYCDNQGLFYIPAPTPKFDPAPIPDVRSYVCNWPVKPSDIYLTLSLAHNHTYQIDSRTYVNRHNALEKATACNLYGAFDLAFLRSYPNESITANPTYWLAIGKFAAYILAVYKTDSIDGFSKFFIANAKEAREVLLAAGL